MFDLIDGIYRPNPELYRQNHAKAIESKTELLFNNTFGIEWLKKTAASFGTDIRIFETNNFLVGLLGNTLSRKVMENNLERVRNHVLKLLGHAGKDPENRKEIILQFDNEDNYYKYISYFYPDEGNFYMSGGTFISGEYPHFVMHGDEFNVLEGTIAHELTHLYLSHLPIPLWLNEGAAQNVTNAIIPKQGYKAEMDLEEIEKHIQYWNNDTIQDYLSGISFSRDDAGAQLSYSLSEFMVNQIAHRCTNLIDYIAHADHKDGGYDAAVKLLEANIGIFAPSFLHDLDWLPHPEKWETGD